MGEVYIVEENPDRVIYREVLFANFVGIPGKDPEFRVDNDVVQWRLVGASSWIDLIDVSELAGPPGEPGEDGDPGAPGGPGPAIELQVTATHLQWRVVGASTWTNLIALALLKGDPGDDGDDGDPGPPGDDGLNPEFQKTATHIQWRLVGAPTWNNLVALADIKGNPGDPGAPGDDGDDGDPGPPGDDGLNPEFNKSATHLQWRLVGSSTWIDLVPLADLKGDPGDDGDDGDPGAPGDDGREVQFNVSATHIQWRYVGDPGWTNLIALADLEGAPGAPGDDGDVVATTAVVGLEFDGGGYVIPNGTQDVVPIKFAGTLTGWVVINDGAWSNTWDVRKGALADWPFDFADSMAGSGVSPVPDSPSSTTQLTNSDTSLNAGWASKTVADGDFLSVALLNNGGNTRRARVFLLFTRTS